MRDEIIKEKSSSFIPHPSSLIPALAAEEDKLLACVHCGLCLEACPTYVHTGDENDSPRGRIYLMRATEEGRLKLESDSFRKHISRCLGCRACEQACPAGVEYGQLLEAARADLSKVPSQQRGMTSKLFRFVLRRIWLHPLRLRSAFALARVIRDIGLPKLLLKLRLARLVSPRFEFALALLDSSSAALQRRKKETGSGVTPQTVTTRVQLFTGCVTEGLFSRVNRATARVLEANNCAVSAPDKQVCCGALHAHAGDLEGARELARRNLDAFTDDGANIITNAGGCGAMLLSYNHLLADDPKYGERARRFCASVRDISQQLTETGIRQGAKLNDVVTTYDASCHLLYGQRAREAPLAMLHAIPELRFVPLEGTEVCCGGAGVYNLLEPEMSERVLDEKLLHIEETGATLLATANPGCHMQIGAGAQLKGMKHLRVCHPVELLDEAYARAGIYEEVISDKRKAVNRKS
jgi:glycolate oxidase iron-sulfur subunit